MNRLLLPIIIIALVGFLGWLTISNREETGEQTTKQNQFSRVAEFSLSDYNGKTVSLGDFQGKPLVINSWAAWCPFCKKELVDFMTAQQEFGDQVVIIAIDRAETLQVAKKYTDELAVTDKLVFLLDPDDSFYRSIGGFSMPETIFVDKEGFIRDHKRGPMSLEEIRQRITNLLKQS